MILVCGEALIDLFVEGGPSDRLDVRAVLGGSPFNVAIALRRLGAASAFLGGISADRFGDALADRLAAEGVDLSHVVRSGRLSTLSVVATDAAGHPAYAFHGEGKADRHLVAADLPQALPENVEAITFGSYTMAVSPVCESFLALAAREAGRRTISIDPNVRPTVTPDMGAWRRAFEAFLPHAHIVKASEEDLALGYGAAADAAQLAARWHGMGPALVLVTHGADGATAFLRGAAPVSAPGRKIAVVDTVGAGDTFHAAALACLGRIGRLKRERLAALTVAELSEVLRYAIAASSITCTRQGADSPSDAAVRAAVGAG